MPASPQKLPFDLEDVYGKHPVRKESIELANEAKGTGGGDQARIRLLTDFLFVKNGMFVFPNYEACTAEFWEDVEVWGFMMSPVGRGRWLAWSLLWHLDWTEKHMELVHITAITGISKEAHKLYRNGNQIALWLNTEGGYTYALMEPEEHIANNWALVCNSWRVAGKEKVPVPFCGAVQSLAAPPSWWHEKNKVAGKQAWQRLVQQQTEHLKNMEDAEDDDDDDDDSDDPQSMPPKRAASTTKGKNRAGHAAKRKRSPETQASPSRAAGRRTRDPRPAGKEGASSGPSASGSKAPPIQVADEQTSAVGGPPSSVDGSGSSSEDNPDSAAPSASKRVRRMSALEQAKDRARREVVDSYRPEPITQAANVLPALKTSGPAPLIFAADSSPARERVSPQQDQAASQGSQLAQEASKLSMAAGGHEEPVEGGAEKEDPSVQADAAVPEDAGSKSAPEVVQSEGHGTVPSGAPVSIAPDAVLASHTAPSADVQGAAPPTMATEPMTAPLASAPRGPPPLQGPAHTEQIPTASAVGPEMGHQIIAVSGPGSVVSSLDDRSSRRRRRNGPA